MENNCFTILWCFLPRINMNWPQVYMCVPHPELPSPPYPSGFGSLLHNKPVFNMNLPLKTNKRLIHHFALEIMQCQNQKVPSNPTTHLLLESSLLSFLGHCTILTTSGTGKSLLKVKDTYFFFPRALVMICFFSCCGFQTLV